MASFVGWEVEKHNCDGVRALPLSKIATDGEGGGALRAAAGAPLGGTEIVVPISGIKAIGSGKFAWADLGTP